MEFQTYGRLWYAPVHGGSESAVPLGIRLCAEEGEQQSRPRCSAAYLRVDPRCALRDHHAHVIVYSKVENEGYLTKKGVHNLRSSFAKDIFVHDLETAYEKQKTYRDDLRLHGRELIAEIVSQINSGVYDNPALEESF